MKSISERHAKHIRGVLSCYDRMLVSGTLTSVGYPAGMSGHLTSHGIRIFDFAQFAEPLRDEIRENAQSVAKANGLEIEYLRSSKFRKDDRIQAILKERGEHPGMVHIFSAMEGCDCFEPWHNKNTGHTSLRYSTGKCIHYYFYFIHESFGLCHLRVPTWAPFRLQFYCNGHNWLANQLRKEGIAFDQVDNTFVNIANFTRAQELADAFPVSILHQELDRLAVLYCPATKHFSETHANPYHWSIAQCEYATDIVFKSQKDLKSLYSVLVRTAVHAVKADDVATFLGRKLHSNYEGEVGNNFHTRIEGTRIKHHMGWASLKMYDKHGIVLRIETTVNDVTFFKHHRTVVHRDNTTETKLAPMKKTIYSFDPLRELLLASNNRYLAFLSDLTDPSTGIDKLDKLAEPERKNDRTFRGFNIFDHKDLDLFVALTRGEWNITGFQNKTLRRVLTEVTAPQLSRIIKRLHVHGLIRKVGKTYKYYLTKFGQQVLLAALKVRELVVIPALATQA
jgi:hypothetical protein